MTIEPELLRALYTAVATRKTQEAKALFESTPAALEVNTPNGTWLHVAARSGDLAMVEYLLEAGLNVNATEPRAGSTPIDFAASEGSIEIVKSLLNHGAVLDVSKPECNPLFAAVHKNHIDVVKLLVEHGIDVSTDYNGKSAISFARSLGHTEIADFLSTVSSTGNNPEDGPAIHDVVTEHLRRYFGETSELSPQEATGQLRIHLSPSAPDRKAVLLVTSGASLSGENETYELMMILPADWDPSDFQDKQARWAVDCLRTIAGYGEAIHPEDTFSYDESLNALDGITRFAGFVVLPELSDYGRFPFQDRVVQFLLLTPLYKEEIELIRREGLYELLSRFQNNHIDMVLDLNRKNAALS